MVSTFPYRFLHITDACEIKMSDENYLTATICHDTEFNYLHYENNIHILHRTYVQAANKTLEPQLYSTAEVGSKYEIIKAPM